MASVADLKLVYLIHGPEPVLLDRALARLRARFAEFGDLEFSSDTFDADSADVDDVIAACNTFPFDSERRLVVVRNVEKFPAPALDRLAAYAADPGSVHDARARRGEGEQGLEALQGRRQVGSGRRVQGREARLSRPTCREMFAAKGRRVDRDGIDLLLEAVGNDLRRLEIEVSKAIAYAGDRETSDAQPTSPRSCRPARRPRCTSSSMRWRPATRPKRSCWRETSSTRASRSTRCTRWRCGGCGSWWPHRHSLAGGAVPPRRLAAQLGRQEWQVRRIPQFAKRFGRESRRTC